MDKLLNALATTVRGWMLVPAKVIDTLSGGKVTPNHITLISFLGHFFVVWALWQNRPIVAAVLLGFFGIMDSLDGALARVQHKKSTRGMFYDAVSDRAKEVLLYIGLAQFLSVNYFYNEGSISGRLIDWFYYERSLDIALWLPVSVLGCSLLISYIKAKGEMAIASHSNFKDKEINRVFADGIARYEVRMTAVIIGLFSANTLPALLILQILLIVTIFQRFVRIAKVLRDV